MRKEIPIPQYDGAKLSKVSIDFEKGFIIAEYDSPITEDIILVPDNIKIYKPNRNDDQLFIGFGDNQMLGYYQGAYVVRVIDKYVPIKPVKCKLVPCKQEVLMAGDMAFSSDELDLDEISSYAILLDTEGSCVFTNNSIDVLCGGLGDGKYFYKVVPI